MKRRDLLKCGIGLAVAARFQPAMSADAHVPYTRELFEASVASGKPFLLDFYATW